MHGTGLYVTSVELCTSSALVFTHSSYESIAEKLITTQINTTCQRNPLLPDVDLKYFKLSPVYAVEALGGGEGKGLTRS